MYPRFISIFLAKQLKNVHVPLDHFPINTLTKDEGKASERPSESQPIPSPSYPSEDQPLLLSLFLIPIQRVLVGIMKASHPVTIQAKEIKDLKAQLKKLKKKARFVRIYLKSQENSQKQASTDTRIRRVQKEAKESKPKSVKVKTSVKSSQQQ
ncbi:hypothetical protein Tco_1011072 [Tanacetum coccineum]